jgi:hypothetical protein
MDEAALLARLDEQRKHWAELPDGKRVQFRRPLETELPRFAGGVTVEHLCEYACGWAGFTEADLLGAAIGADDKVDFSPALWSRLVRDRVDYVQPVAVAMVNCITEHLASKAATAKNSPPSSTPRPASSTRATTNPAPAGTM